MRVEHNGLPYLAEAERNRAAVASLGLVRTPEQNAAQSIRVLGARRIVMAFDPDRDDPSLLRTVVMVLRTAALAASGLNRSGLCEALIPRKGGSVPAPRNYPIELRERAQRLVAEAMTEDSSLSLNAAVNRIGPRVGVVPDTLRGWVKQARIDAGQAPGTTTGDAATIKELQVEVRELKWANEILLAASSFFARELCATRRRVDREVVRDHFRRAVAAV